LKLLVIVFVMAPGNAIEIFVHTRSRIACVGAPVALAIAEA
jgi:hypothetical protein